MKNRRHVLLAALWAWPLLARAQAPARIAWISPIDVANSAPYLTAFKAGMLQLGLIDGQHFVVDVQYADGHYERFPAMVAKALELRPAMIIVVTIASVVAAQRATKTVPIVFVSTNDPVGSGLVASLARPGGNTTGISNQNEDLISKYVELLHETLPRALRVAVLGNSANPSNPKLFASVRDAASRYDIVSRLFEANTPEALDAVYDAIAQHRPDALLVLPDSLFTNQQQRIGAFTLAHRLPAVTQQSEMVAAGCLMSYGAKRLDLYRRAATYAAKILAGARPGDLPVEQPTKFQLVINLKTAKALGITIPQSVLLRADEVIE